jgi:hypothetical protein
VGRFTRLTDKENLEDSFQNKTSKIIHNPT